MKKFTCYVALIILAVSIACCTPSQVIQPNPTPSLPASPTAHGPAVPSVTVVPVETQPPIGTTQPLPIRPLPTQAIDPISDTILQLVINDLSQVTGIDKTKITLVLTESVDWPDGSLGCGTPGVEYLPEITPGYTILLEADGKTYAYHTDQSSQFILCYAQPPASFSPVP